MAIQLDPRLAKFQAAKQARKASAIARAAKQTNVDRIVKASGGRLSVSQAEAVLQKAIWLA